MVDVRETAAKQLREITECQICMSAFTDPRMLPCIHTFCLECLKSTSEAAQKKPGDKMLCPMCRKEFIIPADGMNGVQKNFFMKNFLEFKTTLQMKSVTIICDMCNVRNEGNTEQIPTATMRCLVCQDNYCDSCAKVHQFKELNKNHELEKVGSDATLGFERSLSLKYCAEHTLQPLDCYCVDCKKIVCVTCFVESHKLHVCKDVTTVDEEFRQTIEKSERKISSYADEILSIRNNKDQKKSDFLEKIVEMENEIRQKNQELKDFIEQRTNLLLNEISVIKSNHLKKLENTLEEIEENCTRLRLFQGFCTELRLKGSASDICRSVDELIRIADEFEKDHEAFIGRPYQSVEVSIQTAGSIADLQKSIINVVGQIKESTTEFENNVIVLGLDDDPTMPNDVIKINLHRTNEISKQVRIPTTMEIEGVAAVYRNTMYVAGFGDGFDEIWKYNEASSWMKCASLVQGRRRHSAAFIDEMLYICGGVGDIQYRVRRGLSIIGMFSCGEPEHVDDSVLDSVEAYNAVTNTCTPAGKLVHGVHSSGNCVPIRSSLYIFGGADKHHDNVRHVQMFDTKQYTCTLLTTQMPRPVRLMRAALWETSVILLGCYNCYIFNFETETWEEREQFKTDVVNFGLVLEKERVFVIGGGIRETGKKTWKCRDDVRYVPLRNIFEDSPIEWKSHGKLPKPSLVQAYAKIQFSV